MQDRNIGKRRKTKELGTWNRVIRGSRGREVRSEECKDRNYMKRETILRILTTTTRRGKPS
jgi:hypothetical protein